MELGTFERQLRLMVLLAQNRRYTNEELARRLDISERTIYRYIELFRDMGFVVTREDGCWRIDRSSPFFRDITNRVHFTDEEALTLRHILDGISQRHVQARLLLNKLCRIYDFGLVTNDIETDERLAHNLNTLYDSIKERRVVMLKGYRSASSRSVSDRAVEPFQLLNGGSELRAYELRTAACKTFKLTRIDRVEPLDLLWSNQQLHRSLYTDAFGFVGDDMTTVTLRLGQLAQNILREEYPKAAACLNGDVLTIKVCSFLGIGRFVMGLPEDIEVIGSDAFRDFLRAKTQVLTSAL